MKKTALLISTLALTACFGSKDAVHTPDASMQLSNPLYAERYAEEMVQAMVEYTIRDDTILQNEEKKKIIEDARLGWLKVSQEARKAQREGGRGHLIPIGEYVAGEILFDGNNVHFGPQFEATPHPSVQLYMTTVVDPRDVEFPDETAIHLGELQSAYGPQTYALEKEEDILAYRTFVLWDDKIEKVLSFAQLTKR